MRRKLFDYVRLPAPFGRGRWACALVLFGLMVSGGDPRAGRIDATAQGVALVPVAAGFNQPVAVVEAPDGTGRLFVVERTGAIRIVAGGETLATPFLDVSSLITDEGQEQGLLGLAFHPGYAGNGVFF